MPMVVSMGDRGSHYLTGFGTRQQLMDDLVDAVDPNSQPALLVIFNFGGLDVYQERFGRSGMPALLARLAVRIRLALGDHGVCYSSRGSEVISLIHAPISEAKELLDAANKAIEGRYLQVELTSRFGSVVLPDEAGKPIDAIILADERLLFEQRDRPAANRRPIEGAHLFEAERALLAELTTLPVPSQDTTHDSRRGAGNGVLSGGPADRAAGAGSGEGSSIERSSIERSLLSFERRYQIESAEFNARSIAGERIADVPDLVGTVWNSMYRDFRNLHTA